MDPLSNSQTILELIKHHKSKLSAFHVPLLLHWLNSHSIPGILLLDIFCLLSLRGSCYKLLYGIDKFIGKKSLKRREIVHVCWWIKFRSKKPHSIYPSNCYNDLVLKTIHFYKAIKIKVMPSRKLWLSYILIAL